MKLQNISELEIDYNKTYGNSKNIQDTLKEYMFTCYYFDEYINGSTLSNLFDERYDFILRIFDIQRWDHFVDNNKKGLLYINNV